MQILVTGAQGRIGQILRAAWAGRQLGLEPVWSSRQAGDAVWDILHGPAPVIAKGSVILHLAGVVRGDRAALAENAAMAVKVCATAKRAGATHVFLASSSAVYGSAFHDNDEMPAPAPLSDYGRAKLDMEREALRWAQNAGPNTPGITCLRIGNVLGADALFGHLDTESDITLDPMPGQPGGPIRSYIGPRGLAQVLAGLLRQAAHGTPIPQILNIATRSPVPMADLLRAADVPYHFGPLNLRAIPRVSLSTKRLAALVPLPLTDADALVADWRSLFA